MNRLAFSLAVLAVVCRIGSILCDTTQSSVGTSSFVITWSLWGISLAIGLVAAGIAIVQASRSYGAEATGDGDAAIARHRSCRAVPLSQAAREPR